MLWTQMNNWENGPERGYKMFNMWLNMAIYETDVLYRTVSRMENEKRCQWPRINVKGNLESGQRARHKDMALQKALVNIHVSCAAWHTSQPQKKQRSPGFKTYLFVHFQHEHVWTNNLKKKQVFNWWSCKASQMITALVSTARGINTSNINCSRRCSASCPCSKDSHGWVNQAGFHPSSASRSSVWATSHQFHAPKEGKKLTTSFGLEMSKASSMRRTLPRVWVSNAACLLVRNKSFRTLPKQKVLMVIQDYGWTQMFEL